MFFMMEDGWLRGVSSVIASIAFLWVMVSRYLEPFHLDDHISTFTSKLVSYFYPYIQITFPEQTGEKLKRNEAYTAIEEYLGTISTMDAKSFKAEIRKDQKKFHLSMDHNEEVIDTFKGFKFWWLSKSVPTKNPSFSFHPSAEEKRYYRLRFHCQHRELVYNVYLNHVIEVGKEAAIKKRQRKLYTNSPPGSGYYSYKRTWIHVPFEHPATFDTVAMDPNKKQEIIDDLLSFSRSKDYYKRIGKAWKRGYLLYGPPGTGKSSMVAAMANFLDYDIYDLELTAVKSNTMLRKLLIDTSSKSIIVIEDIDCSTDLTGKRKGKKKKKDEENDKPVPVPREEEEDSKVTLSGLLNFIDGLWSACGGERLIVFTTNHVKKLDPALIRRGRMDKHIELSYCGFEAFKVLAYNYLDIKQHPLFSKVENLMAEVKITPADVAENLIPKRRLGDEEDATTCLENLIQALVECKAKPIPDSNEEDDGEVEEDTSKKKEGDKDEVKE